MSVEPEVLAELRSLRARVPHLAGGLVASVDGLVIAHDTGGLEAEGVAALSAAALSIGTRLTEATGRGGFLELLARGEHGYTATYAAGTSVLLTVVAGPDTNVGRLNLEARRAGGRIGDLVDKVLQPPGRK
jgi:predicted regulator of Ras-like GTPase activity (Roadblock/LC7/MglB family)